VASEEVSWGKVDPACLQSVTVVSPHFDDAALGAAHLLASHTPATVITVFGGWPASYPQEPTPWDAAGGFEPGDDVVAVRRQEDLAAMDVLQARAVWLDFVDHQYLAKEERARAEEIAPPLGQAIADSGATSVFLPMGLGNPDHVLTHAAGLLARQDRDHLTWFCYEDHGYKHIPGLLAWRVAKLFRSGLWPTPAIVPVQADMALKRTAIGCYRSQVPPLEAEHMLSERLDANVPEQYWRLAPPPAGWEGLADRV
jgi:LmbE family N-acetylglucosaminyl deacetylase